jgi:hypothetical protein
MAFCLLSFCPSVLPQISVASQLCESLQRTSESQEKRRCIDQENGIELNLALGSHGVSYGLRGAMHACGGGRVRHKP